MAVEYLDQQPPSSRITYLDEEPVTPTKTLANLPLWKKLLLPSTLPREFMTQQATKVARIGEQLAGATPVGKALELLLAPPKSPIGTVARVVMQPERIGQTMGSLADPLSYVGMKSAEAGIEGGTRAVQVLRGNPEGIATAETALKAVEQEADTAFTNFIRRFRRQGDLHAPYFKKVGEEGDRIWEPVKRLGRNIESPIPLQELKERALTIAQDDPALGRQLSELFDAVAKKSSGMAQTGGAIPADELLDIFGDFGQQIRAGVRRGTMNANESDYLFTKARSIIAKAIEERAPTHLKGELQPALDAWASHATVKDRFTQLVKPGQAAEASTGRGVGFLHRAAAGKLNQDERDFVTELVKRFGVDFLKPVAPIISKLQVAQNDVDKAKRLGKVWSAIGFSGLKGAGYTGGGIGVYEILKSLGVLQ